VIGAASQQITEEFDGLGEKNLVSQTASLMSQSLSDVDFLPPLWSHKAGHALSFQ
jgi:hypothetical protein